MLQEAFYWHIYAHIRRCLKCLHHHVDNKCVRVRMRAYACVRVSCCSCVIIHVILASISVSIALITIKSLTPACQWRNPSSPERGRAGFDSPARRQIMFYVLATEASQQPKALITNYLIVKFEWLCCFRGRYRTCTCRAHDLQLCPTYIDL